MLSFFKKGDIIQGGTLFKEIWYVKLEPKPETVIEFSFINNYLRYYFSFQSIIMGRKSRIHISWNCWCITVWVYIFKDFDLHIYSVMPEGETIWGASSKEWAESTTTTPLVEIGLTDLPKIEGGPPTPPPPSRLHLISPIFNLVPFNC